MVNLLRRISYNDAQVLHTIFHTNLVIYNVLVRLFLFSELKSATLQLLTLIIRNNRAGKINLKLSLLEFIFGFQHKFYLRIFSGDTLSQ